MSGFKRWPEVALGSIGEPKRRKKAKRRRQQRHAGPYSPDQRRQAVEAYLKSGMTQKEFAKVWGTSSGSLFHWVKAYREQGPKALENSIYLRGGRKRGRKGIAEPVKAEITDAKREYPDFGTRSIRNFLFRFRGVKVSDGTVRKTLRAANFPPVAPKRRKRRQKRKPKVQRFERAMAMQLWQTDITSYVLTRHSQRVYLTVFMDDYSRYVVSWSLALAQTKEFVMEALLAGIGRFGKPEEVLTDQGRQYFSWRGKSDFRKLLKKQGIGHVVARAHHPETVGKCERFWETVKNEFWDRVEPQDLTEARDRMAHFIAHYNHFRPHQGLEGMVPADRFFGLEQEIRKTIEDTLSKNELRLALGQTLRKPVFLIGQIGDQPLSLHGERGRLVLQTPEGVRQQIDYEDFGHAHPVTAQNPTTNPTGETKHETANEAGDGEREEQQQFEFSSQGSEAPAQEAPQHEVRASRAAGSSGEGALGDGLPGTAAEGARGIERDHGVLVGEDHAPGDGGASEVASTESVATVPAGDLGYGSRTTDPAQAEGTEGSAEHGTQGADEARGQSGDAAQEDRIPRETGVGSGAADRDSQGDARVSGCEDTDGGSDHGAGSRDASSGDDIAWSSEQGSSANNNDSEDQESDGTSSDGSSS